MLANGDAPFKIVEHNDPQFVDKINQGIPKPDFNVDVARVNSIAFNNNKIRHRCYERQFDRIQ